MAGEMRRTVEMMHTDKAASSETGSWPMSRQGESSRRNANEASR